MMHFVASALFTWIPDPPKNKKEINKINWPTIIFVLIINCKALKTDLSVDWLKKKSAKCQTVCVSTLKLHSLSQSNEGEDGNVVAHADDEDEPQGKGEVLHISQLDHLTW